MHRSASIRFLGTLAAALALLSCKPPELTPARVLEDQLGKDKHLELVLTTGVDRSSQPCDAVGPPDDDVSQTKTGIAVGWLQRRCDDGHMRLELTAEGRRRSASWGRSGDSPGQAREPEKPDEWYDWFVTVADFEPSGVVDIVPGDLAACGTCAREGVRALRKVAVHGHWVPNEEGRRVGAAGWAPIFADHLTQTFVLVSGKWIRLEHLDR